MSSNMTEEDKFKLLSVWTGVNGQAELLEEKWGVQGVANIEHGTLMKISAYSNSSFKDGDVLMWLGIEFGHGPPEWNEVVFLKFLYGEEVVKKPLEFSSFVSIDRTVNRLSDIFLSVFHPC